MTYDVHESSIEGGRPVEVFEWTFGGARAPLFYTSAEDVVTLGAQDYQPVPGLERSEVTSGPNTERDNFEVEVPTTDVLARFFVRGTLPGVRARVRVLRFHRDDLPTPEVVEAFDGFVQSASLLLRGKVTKITARSVLGSVGRQVPRRTFAASCAHVLYDAATCRVDDTDPQFRAAALPVVSQVGNVLTVSGLSGSFADGWMTAGIVESIGTTDFRLVVDHVGDVLTLGIPFTEAPATVNVLAGCAHTLAICRSKFSNSENFGGFSHVPRKDVHRSGVR